MDFTIVKEPDEIPMEEKQEFPVMDTLTLFVKDVGTVQNLISSLSGGGSSRLSSIPTDLIWMEVKRRKKQRPRPSQTGSGMITGLHVI